MTASVIIQQRLPITELQWISTRYQADLPPPSSNDFITEITKYRSSGSVAAKVLITSNEQTHFCHATHQDALQTIGG